MPGELAENYYNFKEELNKLFNNPYVKEADNGFIDDSDDQYINMELRLNRGGDRPEFAIFKKILKDKNCKPIGVANDNPILDSHIYKLEYNDGHTTYLASNIIEENLFAPFDQSGNQFTILDSIIGTRIDGTQVLHQDAFVHTSTDTQKRVNTKKDGRFVFIGKTVTPLGTH